MKKERRLQLKQLQKNLSYQFKKLALLNQALMHKSYANENTEESLADNERMEFLGDAVLELVISHILMETFPSRAEGALTKLRAAMVNQRRIAEIARELHLGEFLLLGRGEDSTEGRYKNSILADTYEAVIAAVYLDGGYGPAFKVVRRQFTKMIAAANEGNLHHRDFKSQLQEYTQAFLKSTPHYKLVQEIGPDHNKSFEVNVILNDIIMGRGYGKNKKSAEQKAAKEALEKLHDARAPLVGNPGAP
jgi:ribonuclease III